MMQNLTHFFVGRPEKKLMRRGARLRAQSYQGMIPTKALAEAHPSQNQVGPPPLIQ
jgi:hypothetical protein